MAVRITLTPMGGSGNRVSAMVPDELAHLDGSMYTRDMKLLRDIETYKKENPGWENRGENYGDDRTIGSAPRSGGGGSSAARAPASSSGAAKAAAPSSSKVAGNTFSEIMAGWSDLWNQSQSMVKDLLVSGLFLGPVGSGLYAGGKALLEKNFTKQPLSEETQRELMGRQLGIGVGPSIDRPDLIGSEDEEDDLLGSTSWSGSENAW